MAIPERIFQRVGASYDVDDNGCWVWAKSKDKDGYGVLYARENGKFSKFLAHRISYMLHVGDIPAGYLVCHTCDNPSCINPDHLFLGTHADNHKDRNQKERQSKGEEHGRAKLTEVDVLEMYRLHHDGVSAYRLSLMFGISSTQAWEIVNGKAWVYLFNSTGAEITNPREYKASSS